ncbi:MAG: hypothetical protein Q8891_00060 [Bacteroidota bacterium]|nr:hypothetical protein [Bacteroidota bacterium]
MRNLKITNKRIEFEALENVPEEFQFVESIARQNAKTNAEVKEFYLEGVKAATELKEKCSEEIYKNTLLWTVRQAIIEKKQK